MSGFNSVPPFGQQTTTSSSLFGTNTTSPAFGTQPLASQQTSLFGAPTGGSGQLTTAFGQPGGSVFGQSGFGQIGTVTNSNSSTSSVFGNAATVFRQGGASSGFGQTGPVTNTTTSASSVFGNPSTVFGQGGASSGFGQTGTVTSSSASASSVFGNTASVFGQGGGSGGFGQAKSVTNVSNSTSSVFGNTGTVFGQGGASRTLFGKPAVGESSVTQSAFSAFGKPVSSHPSDTSTVPSTHIFGGATSSGDFGKPQERSSAASLFGKNDVSGKFEQSSSNTLFGKKVAGQPVPPDLIKQEKPFGLFGKGKTETVVKEEKPDVKKESSGLFGKQVQPELFGKPKEESKTLFGQPNEDATKLFGKNFKEEGAAGSQPRSKEPLRTGSSARKLFGKPSKDETSSNEGDDEQKVRRGFRTQERRLFGKVVPQRGLGRISEGNGATEQQPAQDSARGSRTPLQRQFSDDISRKVSIVCKQVPTKYNNQSELKRHFRRFGHVTKVFPNVNKMQATIHFKTHEEAAEAKRRGRLIARGIAPMSIFWSSYQLPSSPTESSSSRVGVQPFVRAGTTSDQGDRLRRAPWKDMDSVNDEITSMTGPRNLSGDRASPSRFAAGPLGKAQREPSPLPSSSDTKIEKVNLNQLHGMVARTTTEKLQVLNMRDKYLRQNTKKSVNIDVQSAKAFVGTCKDMCPEKERYDREEKRRLSVYEILTGTENVPGKNPVIDHGRAVKEYIRSSPDQDEPLPHELRPLPVLQQTMTYLLKEVANKGEDGRWGDWFDFLWNRTRGIRKDITQQQLCDRYAAELLEKCARFHIYCSERLCEEDMHSFDAKINNENLTKCLQTLKEFYADLEKKHKIFCPSEAEFRAYTVLMNLNEGDTLREVQKLRPEVRASTSVRFALDVYFALSSNNYIKFFRLLKNASYSNACIMHRYFTQVRIKALISMMKGYRPGSKPAQIPLNELVRLLAFESTSEAGGFCSHYGFETTQDEVILDRNKYAEPDVAWAPFRSKNYIESKLMVTCGEMINGDSFPTDYKLLSPQSSFDQSDRFMFDGKAVTKDSTNEDSKPTQVPDPVAISTIASQSAVVKPPAPITVPPELIKDTAKVLFWEVTGEMITKLSQDSMEDVKYLLEQSDQCTDLIVRIVVEKETTNIVEEIIAEMNAEKLCREAEELAQRKERVSAELVEGILYDVLYHETNDLAKMEYREVLHQLKKERIERVTDEIHIHCTNDVSDSLCKEIAADVFKTDVTQRLQAMERAEKTVNLLRTKRYLEIWKKYYKYVLKLKRAVTEFPPSASMVTLKEQNQKMTGHVDNKIVDKKFLVGQRAKLTVQSQYEIMKEREANEYKYAIQDLRRTMQTALAWQPEDITKIVSEILKKKVKTRVADDKCHKVHMQWKMLISLPEIPTNKPKRTDHMATKLLCDWFNRKFSFGSPPQHLSSEKSEVLTLSKSSHILSENTPKIGILHLGVCVRTIKGSLAPSEVDSMKEDRTLQGTSGMIFILPTPVRDLQDPNTTYWSNSVERLRSILESGRTNQAISLVIVMAMEAKDYGNHESLSCVSDNLQLEQLIEDGLIFDYHFVELKFDESLYQGVQVTQSEFYKKVCEGIEWIADRSEPPPKLKVSTLRDFIDTVLIKLFYPPMLQNLKQRKENGYLERSPNSILELYNSVLDHAKYVVTSPSLFDLSWPVPEFVSTESCNLPAKHWNDSEYMEYIGEILDYFKLPEFVISNPESELWSDAKQDISKYCTERIGVKSLVIWANLNSILRQVEEDFEGKCQQFKGEVGCQPFYVHLPFSKIVPLCLEHKMETADFRDYNMDTGKMGCVEELRVAYNETELLDFSSPVEWRHQETEDSFKGSPSLETTLEVAAYRKASERSQRKAKRTIMTDTPSEIVVTKKRADNLIESIKSEQSKSENFIKHLEEELAKGESVLSSYGDLSKINWNQGRNLARRKSFGGQRRKSEEFDFGDKGKRPRKRYSEIGLDILSFPLLSLENNVQTLRKDVKRFGEKCVDHQERMRLDIEYNEMLLSRLKKDRLQHETF